jgi:hypothetical protein
MAERNPFFCLDCSKPTCLFWIKDEVWKSIPHRPTDPEEGHGFTLCPQCMGIRMKEAGLTLTLHDFWIGGYKASKHTEPQYLKEFIRCVLHGACLAAGILPREGWQLPQGEDDYTRLVRVGRTLAEQTPDARTLVHELLADWQKTFP